MRRAPAAVIAVLAACNGGSSTSTSASSGAPAPPPTLVTPVDAAPPDGTTTLPDTDPNLHLDPYDNVDVTESSEAGPVQPRAKSRRILEILLRSTPPGATAIVDGRVIGTTPTYWEGEFTGHEREFTFVLPGHTLARYRFVPIQNGIVHARLTPVLSDVPGATPPLVLPQLPKLAPDQPRKPAASPPDAAPAPELDAAAAADAAPTTLPPPPAPPDAR
jgi:hypothetical protein